VLLQALISDQGKGYKVSHQHLAAIKALHLQQGPSQQPSAIRTQENTTSSQPAGAAAQLHHSSTSPSAPAVNSHGCVGWKAQSSTPEELTTCRSTAQHDTAQHTLTVSILFATQCLVAPSLVAPSAYMQVKQTNDTMTLCSSRNTQSKATR
jgi:hypothetical protein